MKVKISRTMYLFLIVNILWDKAIGATVSVMARAVGGDIWLCMALGFSIGAVLIMMMAYLGSRFPGKTVIEYAEELLGKPAGKAVGIVLAVFFILAYGVSANVLINHALEYFMPETPPLVIGFVFTVICMYAVFLGIEVIGRFAFFGIASIILLSILMVAGTLEEFDVNNLLPLMTRGLASDIYSTIYIFGDVALAVLAAGFLYPMLDSRRKSVVLSCWAMLAGAALVVIWPIFETGVMGPHVMARYMFCCMEQIRAAELTKYFPRFELVMIILFTAGCIVQSSVMYYCAKLSIRQVAGRLKELHVNAALLFALAIVTYYLGADHNYYANFLGYPWPQICTALCVGLPVILLAVGFITGKLGGRKDCFVERQSNS